MRHRRSLYHFLDTLPEEKELTSLIIYRVEPSGDDKPITRIELLSPSNKPNGSHYQKYISKRQYTLRSQLNLVEIDYLHENPTNSLDHSPKDFLI